MIVQHNISAMNASRQLGITTGNLQKSTEKLSSGYRINRAADDAAGLAISEKMRGQIRGLGRASDNAEDGISLIQTAEGGLQETHNILQRMRELAVQAATDTNTNDDRTQIQSEITQLTQEVDRIATTTEFNTKKLLNGEQAGDRAFKAGEAAVEGTFANGRVNLITPVSVTQMTAVNDVIRITIQRDISTADAGMGEVGIAKVSQCTADSTNWASITTLNGTSASVTINEGKIIIENGLFANNKVANTSGTGDTSTPLGEAALEFAISGIENLKAGDVITISLDKMVSSKAAEPEDESLRFQIGANAGQEIKVGIASMKAYDLGITQLSSSTSDASTIGQALDVTSQDKASLSIKAYDKAIRTVSTERSKLGAIQNRLEHTIANLDTSEENLQSAESRVRDVDMADEMTDFSKSNILMQAGQSMLAQANQSNQGVLSLLG